MQWFSRLHRHPARPIVSVTLLPSQKGEQTKVAEAVWQTVFSTLDERHIPATWAVKSEDTSRIAKLLVTSSTPHELALLSGQNALGEQLASFDRQRKLANLAVVPIRCLLTQNVRIHPSLLEQLGVAVVVPVNFRSYSRTGQLRALAWNTWEARATDRAPLPWSSQAYSKLSARLAKVVRQSTRLHLVLEVSGGIHRSELEDFSGWLDVVSDYAQRGWLKTSTVGQQATELAQSISTDRVPSKAA